MQIEMSKEALETMTPQQQHSLLLKLENPSCEKISVMKGGFDLPDGYLYVVIFYKNADCSLREFHCGIDCNGDVSS